MGYNWAEENATKVKCIAGIYPVMNLESWPPVSSKEFTQARQAYELTRSAFREHLRDLSPIAHLQPLAQAKVSIFHLHGDRDRWVPLEQNSQLLYERYKALGGDVRVVTVTGKGHEEAPEFFESCQLASFLVCSLYREPECKGGSK
jgi:dipeptidyl aminopeptidase/acylaminoacyl peptidase